MSNPFQEHFQGDPSALERAAAHHRQVAEAEHHRLFEQNSQQAIRKYNALVIGVLEQLRDVAYPGMIIKAGEVTFDKYNTKILSPSRYWLLGSWEDRTTTEVGGPFRSGGTTTYKVFAPVVRIGLSLDEIGNATSFIAAYLGKGRASSESRDPYFSKEQKSPLDRDALVKMLVELHQPSKNAEVLIQHHAQVMRVLENICKSPLPKQLSWPEFDRPFKIECPGFVVSPVDTCLDPFYSEEDRNAIRPWRLVGSIYDYYYPPYSDFELIAISLMFDTQGNPVHYNCEIYELGQPLITPLDEKALYTQIEGALSTLHAKKIKAAQQSQKKKKGWFGR